MRPTSMRTPKPARPRPLLAVLLAVVPAVLLAGCARNDFRTEPVRPAQWHDCTTQAYDAMAGDPVPVAGAPDTSYRIVPGGKGPCSGGLAVRNGSGVRGVDITALDLDAGTARTLQIDGRPYLLVDSAAHPRGGAQPHLFELTGAVEEVTVHGNPLLPFVATDGGDAPMTARCGRGGVVELLTASTSQPPGVVLAWDVQSTTYRLDGSRTTQLGTRQIRDHAADPLVRKEIPALFDPQALFANCRS